MLAFDELIGVAPESGGAPAAEPPALPRREPRPPRKRDNNKRVQKKLGRFLSESIIGIIGPNGTGKSLFAVLLALSTLDGLEWHCGEPSHKHCDTIWKTDADGGFVYDDQNELIFEGYGPNAVFSGWRTVLSTVEFLDSETGLRHPRYTRLRDWIQVLEAEHAFLFFDEISGVAGSRESMGMPVDVQNILNQMRRKDCVLVWTAPSWARADSIIRSCTKLIVQTSGHVKDYGRGSRSSDKAPKAWIPNRLFRWRAFDGDKVDDWNKSKANQDAKHTTPLRAMFVLWYWGPGSRPFSSYSTMGEVTRVGVVLDGGRCSGCGGRKAVPLCKCGTNHA